MVYKKVTFVSMVLSFLIEGMFGAHSRLMFHSPTQERSIDALACGLERLNSARGVMFDSTTKQCTSLSDAWFSNETIAQNNVYYLLTMYEELFNTTRDTYLRRIPGAFNTGYTVVTTFDTKEIYLNSIGHHLRLYVNGDPDYQLLSMGLRYYWNKITYNTHKNNRWGTEEESALVITESNRDYEVQIAVTESQYMISVDGQSVYNFTQRYSIRPVYFRFLSRSMISVDGQSVYNFTQRYSDRPVYFRFLSRSMVCRRIQYIYPV